MIKRAWIRGRKCSVPNCGKPHFSGGYCPEHYRAWKRQGDPLAAPRCAANGKHREFILGTVLPASQRDCLIWPFGDKDHPVVWWNGISDRAHRIVCELAHGKAPEGKPYALHMCGEARCVNPKHLYWGSQKTNMRDAIRHGRTTRGERNVNAILSETDVRVIIRLDGVLTQQALADMFGVTQATVNDVLSGKTWGWLTRR